VKHTALALGLVPKGREDGEYRRIGLVHYVLEEAFERCQEVVITIV
jgi:hypothetical protein